MIKKKNRKEYTKPEIQKWGSVTDLTQHGGRPPKDRPKTGSVICIPRDNGDRR